MLSDRMRQRGQTEEAEAVSELAKRLLALPKEAREVLAAALGQPAEG